MVDTLQALDQHLQKADVERPKIVVWAHNSHLGDARATDMGKSRGEVNVGQLCRERFGKDEVRALSNSMCICRSCPQVPVAGRHLRSNNLCAPAAEFECHWL